MNKQEFVEAVAKETGLTKKDAEAAVAAYHDTVTKALKKGDTVSFVGFGTYSAVKKAARMGKNPATGEAIKIAASVAPKFKAGKALKDALNKKK